MPTIETQAAAWADHDPDAKTAAEVRSLLQKNDSKELSDRFGTSLEFGTAGLRGVIGGGPNRMNRAVIGSPPVIALTFASANPRPCSVSLAVTRRAPLSMASSVECRSLRASVKVSIAAVAA